MNDFYSLLKQSIIDRGISDAGARDEVYAQARRAMIRQLWAYQPALAPDDIDRRVDDFDATVERIEAELAAVFAEGRGPAARPTTTAAWSPDGQTIRPDGRALLRQAAVPADAAARRRRGLSMRRRRRPRRWSTAATSRRRHRRARPTTRPARTKSRGDGLATGGRRTPACPATSAGRGPACARRGLRLSEQDKVRLLIGTIAALALVLIGFFVYVMLPGGDAGVTLPIDVNREVSDAATAARNATAALDVQRSFVVFDGHDPTIFRSSPDNPVRLDSDAEGGFTRISSSTDRPAPRWRSVRGSPRCSPAATSA